MAALTMEIMLQAVDRVKALAPKPFLELIILNDEPAFKNMSALADAYDWPIMVKWVPTIGKPGEVFVVWGD